MLYYEKIFLHNGTVYGKTLKSVFDEFMFPSLRTIDVLVPKDCKQSEDIYLSVLTYSHADKYDQKGIDEEVLELFRVDIVEEDLFGRPVAIRLVRK